jgi:GNAT superfamily N-acetyltransferase
MEEIRRAVREDAPRLAQLASDLGYTINSDSVGAAIDRLQSDEGAIFVADASEHLTGWIHIYRSHVIQTEPFAEVGGLVVDPLSRGDGVGRRLLEAAERWASANDLTVVRVRSNIVRSNAHRFYERRGYEVEKTSYTFVRSLNPV